MTFNLKHFTVQHENTAIRAEAISIRTLDTEFGYAGCCISYCYAECRGADCTACHNILDSCVCLAGHHLSLSLALFLALSLSLSCSRSLKLKKQFKQKHLRHTLKETQKDLSVAAILPVSVAFLAILSSFLHFSLQNLQQFPSLAFTLVFILFLNAIPSETFVKKKLDILKYTNIEVTLMAHF
jgi:hypothetical protein